MFLIKSLCIKSLCSSKKNLFIFKNKITFDVSSLIRPIYIGLVLKKCLTKLNTIIKLCIILLTKNIICLLVIHRCKYLIFNSVHLSLIESTVGC